MTIQEMRAILSRPTVSVPEIAAVLGISRNLAYRGVKKGEIPSVAVGRSRRVPTAPYRRQFGLEEAA